MKDLELSQVVALNQIRNSDALVITAADASKVLGCDPQTLRSAAKAGTLAFPVDILGSRILIPRVTFLEHLGIRF